MGKTQKPLETTCYALPHGTKKTEDQEFGSICILDRIYEYTDKFDTSRRDSAQEVGNRTKRKSSSGSFFLWGELSV